MDEDIVGYKVFGNAKCRVSWKLIPLKGTGKQLAKGWMEPVGLGVYCSVEIDVDSHEGIQYLLRRVCQGSEESDWNMT
jgi:hypothetical protein